MCGQLLIACFIMSNYWYMLSRFTTLHSLCEFRESEENMTAREQLLKQAEALGYEVRRKRGAIMSLKWNSLRDAYAELPTGQRTPGELEKAYQQGMNRRAVDEARSA